MVIAAPFVGWHDPEAFAKGVVCEHAPRPSRTQGRTTRRWASQSLDRTLRQLLPKYGSQSMQLRYVTMSSQFTKKFM